jgi:Ser/Thr protein kinase RdoA (MazF antagonist)
MNFSVSDGQAAYHVKLNEDPRKLAAWLRASERLAAHYRAPRCFGPLELAGRFGAVFESLPGSTPDRNISAPVLDEIFSLFGQMHRDRALAEILGSTSRPARDTLLAYHLPICEEDLREIEPAAPLPFVSRADVQWMWAEAHAVREQATRSAAFDESVSAPIHGDLWFGNILVDGARWWVIDWDDLKIGDPAHDFSLILVSELGNSGPIAKRLSGQSAAFMERFDLYTRAALLTFVIDPLADWIEAEQFPEVRDAARRHREDLHRWAITSYRALYV